MFRHLLSRLSGFSPLYAPEGAGGSGAGGNAAGENGAGAGEGGKGTPGGAAGAGEAKPPDKTHTQADVDKAVQDRLAREQKKHQKMMDDLKATMAGTPPAGAGATNPDGTPAATGPDAQTLQAKADAEKLIATANQRLVEAAARSEAIGLGIDPKYIADAVRLADLSKIEVGETGDIDAKLIAKALDDVIKRVPVFKMTQENSGGFRVGGQQQNPPNSSGWQNNQVQGTQIAGKSWNRQNR